MLSPTETGWTSNIPSYVVRTFTSRLSVLLIQFCHRIGPIKNVRFTFAIQELSYVDVVCTHTNTLIIWPYCRQFIPSVSHRAAELLYNVAREGYQTYRTGYREILYLPCNSTSPPLPCSQNGVPDSHGGEHSGMSHIVMWQMAEPAVFCRRKET
jgi:hypothetical protein